MRKSASLRVLAGSWIFAITRRSAQGIAEDNQKYRKEKQE